MTVSSLFSGGLHIRPNAARIFGALCGHRAEEIQDPLMQKIRWLDKRADALAKGRSLEKSLRS